jgi:hypothetical protein
MCILTIDSMHLIGHYVPFKFQISKKTRCLHVEMFLRGNKIIFYSSNH